jgi:hypothetical protein
MGDASGLKWRGMSFPHITSLDWAVQSEKPKQNSGKTAEENELLSWRIEGWTKAMFLAGDQFSFFLTTSWEHESGDGMDVSPMPTAPRAAEK